MLWLKVWEVLNGQGFCEKKKILVSILLAILVCCQENNFMFYLCLSSPKFQCMRFCCVKNCYEDLSAGHDHWKKTDLTRGRDMNVMCWNAQLFVPWCLVMLNAFVPARVAHLWAANRWHKVCAQNLRVSPSVASEGSQLTWLAGTVWMCQSLPEPRCVETDKWRGKANLRATVR